MKPPSPREFRPAWVLVGALAASFAVLPTDLFGQGRNKNPTSKIYVSDVSGDAQIDTGDVIEDLSKRSVYTAEGTVIETKAPDNEAERAKAYSTMVYSNGTGAFFDADTRVEVKRFVQEPFTPNRMDVEVEPSISTTQAYIARGAVGLCTSKMVAGSTMVYETPHGSVNIRGQKIVIEAFPNETRISMLEGESTVKAGTMDMGGHTVHAGEQAIIRSGLPGQPNIIQIVKIPPAQMPRLDQRVAMACMAKNTVYFEVRERGGNPFAGGADDVPLREIVPIEVVPSTIPVDLTMSPARRALPPTRPPGT